MTNEQKDEVSAHHPLYDAATPKRTVWQDVIAGTHKLREKHGAYLPQFPAESDASYKIRRTQATLFNMTLKTRDVMTGLAFQESIKLEDDGFAERADLAENIDNQGNHLDVFARTAFEKQFEGYAVILVDAPTVTVNDAEEQMRLALRPYWVLYAADNVINWRYRINPVSKARELNLIVLRECTTEPKGDYTNEEVTRYRVFRLADNGIVSWELYREEKDTIGKAKSYIREGGDVIPALTQIPVAPVSDLGNVPPLLDIADKNVEHWQTYSDYKSLIHKTCVPMLVARGLQSDGPDAPIIISGDKLTRTDAEGGLEWAELQGKSLETIRQALVDNREEIALMGLSLLADKTASVDFTATEALLNSIGETAHLRVMAAQLKDAIELAFGHTAEYLGKPRKEGGSVTLGTAWMNQSSPPQSGLADRVAVANQMDGLATLETQLKVIHPDWDDAQIAAEMAAINKEQAVRDAQEQAAGGFGR